jgi:hypothetical protein
MSGTTIHLSAEHVCSDELRLCVPHGGGTYSVQVVRECSDGEPALDVDVWLRGTLEQLAEAAQRLSQALERVAETFPAEAVLL